jgi:hypothetical protein
MHTCAYARACVYKFKRTSLTVCRVYKTNYAYLTSLGQKVVGSRANGEGFSPLHKH